MKTLLLAAALLFAAAAHGANDRTVTLRQLPAAAQQFLQENYADVDYLRGRADGPEHDRAGYTVHLADGTVVRFDRDGVWTGIENPGKHIPPTVLPAGIADFIASHYAGQSVISIEHDRRGYLVELSDFTTLAFDMKGKPAEMPTTLRMRHPEAVTGHHDRHDTRRGDR